eukprot:TRINITY_DN567_c1_g2_i1.p1 TRINITY_DN567_c1_g2~~TRINITY_DN567_c1_g2_i1.p1  ORF type:complete len:164 (-),score=33.01 TRINITY_DN567_c1_g2_i1:131-622(-)
MNWKSTAVDEVSKSKIWGERIKREQKGTILVEEFSVNPRSLSFVTEKPNTRPARFLDREKALLDSLQGQGTRRLTLEDSILPENEFSSTFRDLESQPRAKQQKALTTTQEYGWFDPEEKTTSTLKELTYRPKVQCAETKFAAEMTRSAAAVRTLKNPGPTAKK